jgi:hypothetical protein
MNGHIPTLEAKADEILRRGLKVQYGGNLMIRADMPSELFPKLRRSGMSVALIGMESASPAVLKHMRKRHDPHMASNFLQGLHTAGIRAELNFIVGFPTETEEDFAETLAWLRQNRQYIDAVVSASTFCMVPSDLWNARDEHHIVVDENDPVNNWRTRDTGNTFEVRQRRFRTFVEVAGELGLLDESLLSVEHLLKPYAIPSPSEFRKAYIAHYGKAASPDTREVVGMVVSSLRSRGVRGTFRRALEWVQTR